MEVAKERCDLGEWTGAVKYEEADHAYDKLLGKLADRKFAGVSPELRDNLVAYYGGRKAPVSPATKKASAEWAKVLERVEKLKQGPPEIVTAQ
jgi:hypothetical protein